VSRVFYAFLAPALLAIASLAATVAPSLADPNLPNVPAHRHYVVSPTGAMIEVGPRLCDDPTNSNLQRAFNQYHNNVHTAGAGAIGPAAPGLHNGSGAEIVARGCSFVPPAR
jgi:hypothetical protein